MLKIRPFIEGKDEPHYLNIVNLSMAEFLDYTPITREEDEMGRKAPNFVSQGQFIAEWIDLPRTFPTTKQDKDEKLESSLAPHERKVRGEPVGFVHAEVDPLDKENKGYMSGPFVIPEFRRKHIGTALAKAAIKNFQERGIKKFEGNARANSIPAQKLLEKLGFKMYRVFSRMKRSLSDLPKDVGENKDIKITDIGTGDEALKLENTLLNEAMKEHFNFRPMTLEENRYYTREQEKQGVKYNDFIAYLDNKPIGLMITVINPREIEHQKKNIAWLAVVGVLKPYRSKGIGKALLIHAMNFLKQEGMEEAMLGVDDTNVTKAIKIYESLGFEVMLKYYRYIKEL